MALVYASQKILMTPFYPMPMLTSTNLAIHQSILMPQKSVTELMQEHQSIRKFTSQPITQELLETCIAAGQAASSSSFVQVTSVIQVNDSSTRAALAQAAGGQPYVESAAVFLVFCADLQRNQSICLKQQQKMPTGFVEQTLIGTVDTALFAQNVMLAAQSNGLGGVFIGGLRNQPEKVTQLLKLPPQVFPIFGLCLGYADQNPGQKPRLPVSTVLHQDVYQNIDADALGDYNDTLSSYYSQRTQGKSQLNFSQHIVKTMAKEARPHMLDYLHSQGLVIR
jgi:nitroreductase